MNLCSINKVISVFTTEKSVTSKLEWELVFQKVLYQHKHLSNAEADVQHRSKECIGTRPRLNYTQRHARLSYKLTGLLSQTLSLQESYKLLVALLNRFNGSGLP